MFCYSISASLLWMVIVTFVETEGIVLGRQLTIITVCQLKLQNNIKITDVICPLPDMGCRIDPSPSDYIMVLSGTKIRYRCKNSRPWEQSTATNLTATCQGQRWIPRTPRCDQFITMPTSNPDWSSPTLWKPPVFTSKCGISTIETDVSEPLVWSGEKVELGEFPWHAGVYRSEGEKSRKPICGATIIASRYLLSAAHCFTKETNMAEMRNPNAFYIIVGKLQSRNDLTERSQQRHDITHIITNAYRGNNYRYQNDVAVLRTKSEITFNSNVSPICMINDYFPHIQENADLLVAGWGFFNSSEIQSENLMSIKLPYISYEECSLNSIFNVSTLLTTEKFCTLKVSKSGSLEMSLDEGDSGGGLVTKGPNNAYYLIGIVSVRPRDGVVVMCTHVPHFHKWISETTSYPYIDLPPEEQWTGVCGQSSQSTKTPVTARTNAPLPDEFSWRAFVRKRHDVMMKEYCGATIISSYTLLSAAHCFYDLTNHRQRSPVDYKIKVVDVKKYQHFTKYHELLYEVESLIFSKFQGARLPYVRDIVIIVTKKKIPLSSYISPICLFQDSVSSFSLASNELLHRVHWKLDGRTFLMVEHQPYISLEDCYELIPPSELAHLQSEKFCTTINKTAIDWEEGYDGGIGLVWKNPDDFSYYLVGIELEKVKNSSIVLNTNVSFYLPWIHKQLNQIHEAKNETFSG